MSNSKASRSINLPQLQNLIKRDPESYRDEVCVFSLLNICYTEERETFITLTWWKWISGLFGRWSRWGPWSSYYLLLLLYDNAHTSVE